jgi:dihydrodipicolinate synthase/N-acetylneuraminate lyase
MMTKVPFAPETIQSVLQMKQIAGLKDSSGNLEYFGQLVGLARQRPDWGLLVGPEHLLAETVKLGGTGGVNGGANFHPRLFVDLYEAACRGDQAQVDLLQARLLQLGGIYQVGKHASAVIKGMKCSLSLLGICSDFMAEPFARFRSPERERVRAILAGLGLLP